ncbi:MAG: L,D-transpeptidase family protein [Robiginitomaculum sp.]
MRIIVDTSKGKLKAAHKTYICAHGLNGSVSQSDGREGDGKTPLGVYALRYGLYREDRFVLPKTGLPFYPIAKNDGWCDMPHDPAYNCPVRLPYGASAEKLWKKSHGYDVLIVFGYNDNPPIPGLGSAIFLHIARPRFKPTQGCIGISKRAMGALVKELNSGDTVEIV